MKKVPDPDIFGEQDLDQTFVLPEPKKILHFEHIRMYIRCSYNLIAKS